MGAFKNIEIEKMNCDSFLPKHDQNIVHINQVLDNTNQVSPKHTIVRLQRSFAFSSDFLRMLRKVLGGCRNTSY